MTVAAVTGIVGYRSYLSSSQVARGVKSLNCAEELSGTTKGSRGKGAVATDNMAPVDHVWTHHQCCSSAQTGVIAPFWLYQLIFNGELI